MEKSLFKSKTFWLNVTAAAIGLTLEILQLLTPETMQAVGLFPENRAQVLAGIGFVTTVGNLILRRITNTPIKPILKR